MGTIAVGELRHSSVKDQDVEIVERKGLGHPDSITDLVMNDVSVALSREYKRRFGAILHHNIDKGLLVAGETEARFGGGLMKRPMLFVFGDRATYQVGGEEIPIEEITTQTAKLWFKNNMRFIDPERHVNYQIEIKPGSADLTDIFRRRGAFLGANDTSAAVGYAPLTETESLVLETERYLNARDFKKRHPESGEDIKIMALRHNDTVTLTVAMAFVDRFIESEADYFKKKQGVLEAINEFTSSRLADKRVKVEFNTLDAEGRGIPGIYTTVTGTSADGADSGQVGRGNRANGIISLSRPSSSEAAAGKNPVSHVGKIYNLLSFRMADTVVKEVSGIEEAYVWLLSTIGAPVNDPKIASAQLVLSRSTRIEDVAGEVTELMRSELEDLDSFIDELAEGKIPIC